MIYDILGEVFKLKICFVTGGTGGHIYPALALADKMKELDSSTEILFIGNDDRMEKDLIPQTAALSVLSLKMAQNLPHRNRSL